MKQIPMIRDNIGLAAISFSSLKRKNNVTST